MGATKGDLGNEGGFGGGGKYGGSDSLRGGGGDHGGGGPPGQSQRKALEKLKKENKISTDQYLDRVAKSYGYASMSLMAKAIPALAGLSLGGLINLGSGAIGFGDKQKEKLSELISKDLGLTKTEADNVVTKMSGEVTEQLRDSIKGMSPEEAKSFIDANGSSIIEDAFSSSFLGDDVSGGTDDTTTAEPKLEDDAQRFWNTLKDEWFAEEGNVKDLIQEHTDFMAGKTREYTNNIRSANDKQKALIDGYQRDSAAGTGLFKPMVFTVGGNTLRIVPGSNLRQAGLIEGMGQDSFKNTTGVEKDIYNASSMLSPSKSRLAYIDALNGMVGMEEGKRAFDEELAYKKDALNKGIAVNNRALDQNEPGWADYAGSALSIWNSLRGILNTGD